MTTETKRWAKQRHRSRKHWWFRKTGPLIRAMFRTSLLCYLWSGLTEIRFVLKLTVCLTKRHANLNFEFLHSYGPFHTSCHIYINLNEYIYVMPVSLEWNSNNSWTYYLTPVYIISIYLKKYMLHESIQLVVSHSYKPSIIL